MIWARIRHQVLVERNRQVDDLLHGGRVAVLGGLGGGFVAGVLGVDEGLLESRQAREFGLQAGPASWRYPGRW